MRSWGDRKKYLVITVFESLYVRFLCIVVEIITDSFSQAGLTDDLNRKPCVRSAKKTLGWIGIRDKVGI